MRHRPGNDGAKTFYPKWNPDMTVLQTGTMFVGVPVIYTMTVRPLWKESTETEYIPPHRGGRPVIIGQDLNPLPDDYHNIIVGAGLPAYRGGRMIVNGDWADA